MKNFYAKIVALWIAALPVPSYAVWGNLVKTVGYYTFADGSAYFRTGGHQKPGNWTNGGGYLALDNMSPNFRILYGAVMAAYAGGQLVSLGYSGCKNGCPMIIAIAVGGIWRPLHH